MNKIVYEYQIIVLSEAQSFNLQIDPRNEVKRLMWIFRLHASPPSNTSSHLTGATSSPTLKEA